MNRAKVLPLIGTMIVMVACAPMTRESSTPTPTKILPTLTPTETLTKNDQLFATINARLTEAPTAEEFIPKGYYESPCLIPKGVSINSYLTEYEWVDPYQENIWDCSQMSAYIEWLVENCGYEANIVIASQIDHVWVEIKIGGKWRPYEATWGSFYLAPKVLREISAGNTVTLEDIYEVYDFSTRRKASWGDVWIRMAMREWTWWEE